MQFEICKTVLILCGTLVRAGVCVGGLLAALRARKHSKQLLCVLHPWIYALRVAGRSKPEVIRHC